jgi:hypothetical protein
MVCPTNNCTIRIGFAMLGHATIRSPLALPEADQQLRHWVSAFGTPQQVPLRSQIVLAAAEGQSDNAIAQQLEVNRKTVMLWRTRFTQEGLDVCGRWHRGGVANRPMVQRRSRPSWMQRYVANPRE